MGVLADVGGGPANDFAHGTKKIAERQDMFSAATSAGSCPDPKVRRATVGIFYQAQSM
jgi:hypothetical protein